LEASLDDAVLELAELLELLLEPLLELVVVSESSLACFWMLLASALTFSSSPAHGNWLAQYSETYSDALLISPMALLTAFAVHFVLHVAAILLFSSSVAFIAAY